MDNAAEQYDLISVLWRLEGFRGIEGEIGQGFSIDERVAATVSLQHWVAQLRRSAIR